MIGISNNPTQEHISEWREAAGGERNEQGNAYLVHRYSICGTSFLRYIVYEPSALMGNHSSITTREEKRPDGSVNVTWLGDVRTRRLPGSLEALKPGSQERIDAVTFYLTGWKTFAESLTRATYPADFL